MTMMKPYRFDSSRRYIKNDSAKEAQTNAVLTALLLLTLLVWMGFLVSRCDAVSDGNDNQNEVRSESGR